MKSSKWCNCPFCTHRLFRIETSLTGRIEVKCPSCKRIYTIDFDGMPFKGVTGGVQGFDDLT